ncbi:MAG: thiamine ABC transporter substrate binding subunit [Alphaproteobacteria bacterium]|nr:thiamine ABC transporter substrate binding subunit [Alphaproteobacteria bacterium]
MRATIPGLAILLTILAAPPASAGQERHLTIYTYDAFAAEWGPGPELKAKFEPICACTVDFIAAASSIGALRRVQLEGNTTSADLVLGLDTSLEAEAEATGLFSPHLIDTSASVLPGDWRSSLFVAFDYGYFAFVYDRRKLADPPTSFVELVNAPPSLKIVVQDPRSATPGLGLVLWIKDVFGDKAPEIWAGLVPKIVTMTKSWSEAYNLFLLGEADMVLSYTTSPAFHLMVENDPGYAAARFDEGHYVQIEIAGILQSSPNKDLARRFLAWLISNPAQEIIPTTNWMYPVAPIPLPEGYANLITPHPVRLIDAETVAKNRRDWIDEALAAFR